MKKIVIMLVVFIIGIFIYKNMHEIYFSKNQNEKQIEGLQRGDKLKKFKIYSYPDEKELTNEDFKGKITILNFGTTWCPYCLEEKKEEEIFLLENSNLVTKINLVSIMMSSKKEIEKYLKKHKFTMKIYQDKNEKVGDGFFIRSTPTTIIIDENGVILERYSGVTNFESIKIYLKELGVE